MTQTSDMFFKKCSICAELKSLNEYRFREGGIPRKQCQSCQNSTAKKRRDKRIDYMRDYARTYEQKYRATPRQRSHSLYSNARIRSEKRGLEFNLSRQRILDAILKGKCERSGVDFDLRRETETASKRRPFGPSIDKIDCNGGYTDENIQVVAWCYNSGKGEMTDAEFIAFCRQVVRNNPE